MWSKWGSQLPGLAPYQPPAGLSTSLGLPGSCPCRMAVLPSAQALNGTLLPLPPLPAALHVSKTETPFVLSPRDLGLIYHSCSGKARARRRHKCSWDRPQLLEGIGVCIRASGWVTLGWEYLVQVLPLPFTERMCLGQSLALSGPQFSSVTWGFILVHTSEGCSRGCCWRLTLSLLPKLGC